MAPAGSGPVGAGPDRPAVPVLDEHARDRRGARQDDPAGGDGPGELGAREHDGVGDLVAVGAGQVCQHFLDRKDAF